MRVVSDVATWRIKEAGEPASEVVAIPPGTPFEMDDEKAEEVIARGTGRLRAATESDEAGSTDPSVTRLDLDDLVAGIAELDTGNPSLWLGDGRPDLKALRNVCENDNISAAQRDDAWTAFLAG